MLSGIDGYYLNKTDMAIFGTFFRSLNGPYIKAYFHLYKQFSFEIILIGDFKSETYPGPILTI